MKITIDRSKWLRGEGSMASYLLRESDGKMCCLGQVLLQLGKTEEQILMAKTPSTTRRRDENIEGDFEKIDRPGNGTCLLDPRGFSNEHVDRAMAVNDSMVYNDAHRERKLTELLSHVGLELEFVDGPVQ